MATTSHAVTIAEPAPDPQPGAAFAQDAFTRTVANGLGSADIGGVWTTTAPSTGYSVANGTGLLRSAVAGAMENAYLNGLSATSTDVQVTFSPKQAVTGAGAYVSLLGRTLSGSDYRARVKLNANGTLSLQVMRGATVLRTVAVSGLTYVTGDQIQLRLQVTGTSPTNLAAKVWKAGQAEPSAWQATATDTTAALQAPGGIGLSLYLSGSATLAPVSVAFDNLTAKPAV